MASGCSTSLPCGSRAPSHPFFLVESFQIQNHHANQGFSCCCSLPCRSRPGQAVSVSSRDAEYLTWVHGTRELTMSRRPYPTPPFVPPPCTVLSSLYSAVPATVASSFQEEPSQIRGYFYGDSRHNPTWYKDVPEDLKSTLYSMYNTDAQEAFSSSFYFSESSIRGEVYVTPGSVVANITVVTSRYLVLPGS